MSRPNCCLRALMSRSRKTTSVYAIVMIEDRDGRGWCDRMVQVCMLICVSLLYIRF